MTVLKLRNSALMFEPNRNLIQAKKTAKNDNAYKTHIYFLKLFLNNVGFDQKNIKMNPKIIKNNGALIDRILKGKK